MRGSLARCFLVFCMVIAVQSSARADDWPQWMGPQRDDVWHEKGILEKFPKDGPTIRWRVPIHGGYAGPAVADGKVYVTDFVPAEGDALRTGNPGARTKLPGRERVLCLAVADGKQLWKHEYECPYDVSYACGPRCTPTVHDGKVYTLGAMGDLFCLDARNGKVLWSSDFKKAYGAKTPMWGFTGHPLVDGKKLICLVGGEGSVAVAFDKDSGKEIWNALSAKEPGYSPPTLIEAGGKRQLIIWHAEAINGLDPATGAVYWSVPLAPDYGMSIMAPRQSGSHLFAAGIGNKGALLKLAADKPAAEVVWRGSKEKGVYPVNSTPIPVDGYLYGVDTTSELRCIKLQTGERLWETKAPVLGKHRGNSGTAFLTKNGDRFFLFNETGCLIIAKLTPKGFEEVSQAKLLEPTGTAFGREVVWSHPAYADKCVFARNDKEIVCVSLAAP